MTTPEIQTHVPLGISESHESRHDIQDVIIIRIKYIHNYSQS